MSTIILGVPAAAHRDALLRTNPCGGRPALVQWTSLIPFDTATEGVWEWVRFDGNYDPRYPLRIDVTGVALILSHPTDPEAGAMGLARLAWVAWAHCGERPVTPMVTWGVKGSLKYSVKLGHGWWEWSDDSLPTLRDATSAAHAVALVAQHLGLLERVELVEVADGG